MAHCIFYFSQPQSMPHSNAILPYHLSIVLPCYNERGTVTACLDKVLALRESVRQLEIVIVDDGSVDGTVDILRSYADRYAEVITLQVEQQNRGKGHAVRLGIARTRGDVIALQDADLEYDPDDYLRMLALMHRTQADAVIGSRFIGAEGPVVFFWHRFANGVVTLFSNMVSNLYLTDITCCYKILRADLMKRMQLREDGFAIDAEIVARLAAEKRRQRHLRIYEMKVSYAARSYAEGKKIRPWHLCPILWAILRYNRAATYKKQ